MQRKNRLVWYLFVILAITFCLLVFFTNKNPSPSTIQNNFSKIKIGNNVLEVEKATTPQEWEKGLSGRTSLAKNSGMIFIFPNKEIKNFWMKDTLIPLDIIWINENRVTGLDQMFPELNVPITRLKRYYSPSPVSIVIETPLNWTKENNIKIGDTFQDIP